MSVLAPLLLGLGGLLLFDGLTRRSRSWRALRRLSGWLEESTGLHPGAVAAGCGVAGLAAAAVVAGLTRSLPVACAFGVAGAWLPLSWLRSRRDRRRRDLREAWPDAIASLVSAVRAGISLPEACIALASRGPHELRPGFAALAASYRATGSLSAGLARLRAELSDPVADRVALALELAHEVGGSDLVRVLGTLGNFVREDLRVRREVEARWSWTVTAARLAAAAPWVVLVMMATRPEAARAYSTPQGAAVIGVGAAATLVGYRLMLAAARLPEEGRLR